MKEITNIETIHNILFQSLCYFDDFCRQNGLKYFLSNGTLLVLQSIIISSRGMMMWM